MSLERLCINPGCCEFKMYEKVEFDVMCPDEGDAIVDTAYVLTYQSGKTFRGKGFICKDCSLDRGSGNINVSSCRPYWKIRFSPLEEGDCTVSITARTAGDRELAQSFNFKVRGREGKGFIKVGGKRDYFEFDNGECYFPIGINAIDNSENGILALEDAVQRLSANGGNYIRLFLSVYLYPLFDRDTGELRQDNAWGIDYILELCEKHGIYIKLCFEHMRNFVNVEHPMWSDHESSFSYKKGGPCKNEYDFFTLKEAKDIYKENVIDYIIARWGYSTHIFSWELWNEINCVYGVNSNFHSPLWKAVIDWGQEIARYIKDRDDLRHMVVNSIGSYLVRKEFWDTGAYDFSQVHGYWGPDGFVSETAKDISVFVEEYLRELKPFNKPRLFAEYGMVAYHWGRSDLQYADVEGIVIRDGAWCSLACGGAGTAMFWWGQQLMEMGLECVFKGISSFVKDINFLQENFKEVFSNCTRSSVKVRGLKGEKTTILWLKNKYYSWWNRVMGVKILGIHNAVLEVYDHSDGDYWVQIWDTVKGEIVSECRARSVASEMLVYLPEIVSDCAVKIFKC